jgi:hypothetical protein
MCAHPLRLDRSRYFSSVHGNFDSAARFYQDGLPFDAHGEVCTELCSAAQLASAQRKAPRLEMPDVADQMPDENKPSSDIRSPASDIDLELWAKGETRYLPAEVFAAIRARYNKSVTTFGDAVEFLVNDVRLIPREQASLALLSMGRIAASVKEEA